MTWKFTGIFCGIYKNTSARINRRGGAESPQALTARPGGVAATHGLVAHWHTSSGGSLRRYFSLILEKFSVNFQVIPRTFISAQKQHHDNSAENSVSPG